MPAFYCLIGLYTLPVLGSFYFSHTQNIYLLISSLTFIIIFPLTLFILTSHLPKWLSIVINSLISLVVITSEMIRFVSFYLQGEGFNDRFFFHFTLGSIQSAWFNYPALIWFFLLLVVGVFYLTFKISYKKPFTHAPISIALIFLCASLLLNSALNNYLQYQWSIVSSSTHKANWTADEVKKLGLDPESIIAHDLSAQPGRNLVLIYLESLETVYTDNNVFNSLTPGINQLKKQGSFFSDIKAFTGTGWTIAGMVSSQCGTPLLYNSQISGNDILTSGFLGKASCLSDILHSAGYQQAFLGGATLRFAGKGQFLHDHHYDDVNGLDELLPVQKDQSYRAAWGLYDDTLFELSVDKFNELAALDKPFNLTLLTLDTHHPSGHPSHSCKPYPEIDNSILHAVHCTDQLVNRFIKRISQHPAFKNTTIVLLSDHLAMRNSAEKYYPDNFERKNTFIVLNSDLQGEISTTGTHMDMAPTILDILGIKHNTHFLAGSSLLQNKKKILYDNLLQPDSLAAIKDINTNLLSANDTLLCPNNELTLKSHSDQFVIIGNKKISLSYQGHLFNDRKFKNELSMIIFFNDDKNIKHTFIVNRHEIPYIISEYNDLSYILLNSNNGEIDVWFGHENNLRKIDNFKTINSIDIHLDTCLDNFENNNNWLTLSQLAPYTKKCEPRKKSKYTADYSRSSNILALPDVLIKGQHFKIKLIKNITEDAFKLKEYTALREKNIKNYTPCIPMFSNNTLYIPQLRINDNMFTLKLKLSSENTLQFIISGNDKAIFE